MKPSVKSFFLIDNFINNDFINNFHSNSGKVLSSFACSHSFNPHNGAILPPFNGDTDIEMNRKMKSHGDRWSESCECQRKSLLGDGASRI